MLSLWKRNTRLLQALDQMPVSNTLDAKLRWQEVFVSGFNIQCYYDRI
jgi:hypothetical protein